MSGEQLPSGRERAIETLIDSEPNGASYRANRIRDELVPNALSSRPNLITRSALIEQAHSLAEYEIDSSDKYMDAFGLKDLDGSSDTENAFSEATVQRILRHHEKIVAIKSQKAAATPPPQLVANLKSLYGSDLHKNVLHHKAFDNDEIDNPKNDGILESIIGTVCRDVCDGLKEDALHGLLLAVLSVLTGLDHDGAEVPDLSQGKAESRAIERRHDPSDVPALQVGAILSLMRSNVEKGPFSLDEKVLKYLGDAASAYEDRIDVQKARLLARAEQEAKVVRVDRKQQKTVGSSIEDDDNITIPIAPFVPTDASEPSAVVVEDDTLPNHEDQAVEGNDPDEEEDEEDDEGCDDDDDDDDDNIGNDLLRPTVFNQIISAVADGVDRAALRLAAGGLEQDSSDSDSTNDNDSDHNLDRYAHEDNAPHVELDDESSSSDEEDESEPSPEVVDDDDDDHEGEDDEDDDDDDDDDEEDAGDSILRQALAMSLSDHTGFAEAPGSNFQSSEGPEDDKDDDILLSTPKPESRRSSRSKFDFSDSDHPNLNDLDALPDLPMPPSIYPYWSSLDSVTDVDDKSDPAASLHPCLDPSALSKFGTVPSSLALVRLLQNTLGAVTGHLAQGRKQRSGENGIKSGTVPGGMGCMLFGSEAQLSDDRKVDMDDEFNRTAASLQLLVATVVLCFESRKEAIEGLREAISAEQRNVQGDDEAHAAESDDHDGNDTPLSDDDEQDNDAVTLAMRLRYPTDSRNLAASVRSTSTQAESLESKGMSRKAAAAGWDAAMRIKSLKKKTDDWKNRVKLYSYCTLLALKSFRTFMQFCVSVRLDRHALEDGGVAFFSRVSRLLPTSVLEKLDAALSILLSVSEFRSLPTLVSGDDEGEVEDLFMPLRLYCESLTAWGECTALTTSSTSDREALLGNLVRDCFSNASTVQHFGSFDTLSSLPTTEDESQLYRLDILCRRFCVTDLLDHVVPRPLCFNPELESAGSLARDTDVADSERSEFSCSLVTLLYFSSLKASGACLRFLRRLSMAICHRCCVRGILWDGLYACSHFEADEAASSPASVPGSESLRVSGSPSSSLQLDSTKCSDSIAILSDSADSSSSSTGSSAHQRASKVWGTVVSSTYYNPKSGVHRWAVRLDRCERGHVFVGVATAQASVRTYVGGDKYGWGVIGTQALWHDRRKIRGDYGATFRTGSIIVVTLDTDAGTLSFSTWKDVNPSAGSFSLDPLSPTLSSPRRQTSSGGTLEDWGIAFEGLPLDAKLYPAVGLYQRDDMVTLLKVESGIRSGGQHTNVGIEQFAGGAGYFPGPNHSSKSSLEGFSSQMTRIRNHNSVLSWGSIEFVDSILGNIIDSIDSGDVGDRNLSLNTILPSIAAAVCLLPPSIPVLSARFALHLLSRLTECITRLDTVINDQQSLFSSAMKEGKWVIRATGSSGNGVNEFEEYVVNFKSKLSDNEGIIGFVGSGIGTTGKSKNGLVSITGTVYGSLVHFVEEWTDGVEEGTTSATEESSSSCIVSARLGLDAMKFEGTYRNVQYRTTGHIAGLFLSDREPVNSTDLTSENNDFTRSQAILRLAHGHLAMILGNDAAGDHAVRSEGDEEEERKVRCLSFLTSAPFREGFVDTDGHIMEKTLDSLRELYSGRGRTAAVLSSSAFVAPPTAPETNSSSSLVAEIAKLDGNVAPNNCRRGSFHSLCPDDYTEARLHVMASLFHHSGIGELFSRGHFGALDNLWNSALSIMDSQVRAALSDGPEGLSMKERGVMRCQHVVAVSRFLLSLQPSTDHPIDSEDIISTITLFFAAVHHQDDLKLLADEFAASMRRAFLRYVALTEVQDVLPPRDKLNTAMVVAFESTSVAIPRFLGRGLASKKTSTSRLAGRRYIDNGNHYMARLSGAGLFLRNKIRSSVHSIVANIGEVLCQISSSTTTSNVDRESSLLSILPVFATAMLSSDVENVVLRSQILDSLSVISSSNRAALRSTQCEGLPSNETENEFLVAEMRALIQRDVARTVVLTAVSVSHTLTYQTCQWSRQSDVDPNSDSISAALCGCVGLLLNEVEEVVPLMETAVREGLDRYLGAQGDDQYNSWVNITMPDSNQSEKAKRKRAAAKPLRPSLSHLFEKGMFAAVGGTTSTPTKAGSKAMSSGKAPFPSGSHYESLTSTGGLAFDLYVSRWLDVMHCVVWSAEASKALVNLGHWMDVMFSAIGLSIHRAPGGDVDGVVLRSFDLRIPAHYRARILRFLPTLLSLATADDRVVEGLFKIVGEANDVQANSLHGDESLVASESIACMRSLYSPGCHEWRKAIDRVIVRKIADRADVTSSDAFSLGVLAFLAGSITALGPGTHVLLKPAAAASLSQDAQSTPSSKSSAGSGSSNAAGGVASHHVVGTGTEGIVAGLCRSEAAAGVMSNIDTKTGMCEVILVERRRSNKPHLSSALSKVTLTVRALRSPLADVAKAEQIPLVLGPSFPVITFLHASLPSALAFFATTSQEIAVDGTFKLEHIQCLHASILTLRAAIVLLSDDRLLDEFKSHDGSRAILSELLHLAGKQECLSTKVLKPAGVESLASLPVHEGRYVHFVTMLAEIQVRRSTLEIAVEESWFRRANEIHARQTRKSEAVEENDGPQEVCADAASATMPSSGHEDSNLSRASRGDAPSSRRATSQSSVSSNSTEDEEESEAAATAASHLREAAIAQMLELGLPRSWSELALRRTGGTNIEAAVHFCLERGGDMERLLAEERERDRVMQRSAAGASRRRSNRSERSSHLLRQLLEMGFPSRWCAEALAATQNNVDEALTWILSNGVRLSEEDEGIDDDDGADFDEDEDEEDDDEEQPQPDEESDVARVSEREQSPTQPAEAPASATVATAADGDVSSTSVEEPRGWCGSVTPVRFISGRSIINSKTLSISGLPAGGFSSVGTKGVLLTSGKWYYEAILETAGCLQIGWADGSFSGHCHAERGDGCGDGPSSWAFDGWRRYRWHASATEWGCRWKEGDVVGCLVDMDEKIVSFTLNGKGEEVGMGVAFSGDGFRPCGGVYACVSFNRKEKLRLILGGEGSEPFTFSPPAGFVGVGEAILSAVREREVVLDKEAILLSKTSSVADGEFGKRFLCDFSDGEHGHELFAWQHRYYGSDASVHLGSSRNAKNTGNGKSSTVSGSFVDSSPLGSVSLLLEKRWSSTKVPNENHTIAKANMSESLVAVSNEVAHDALQEGFSLGILFSRKFILHLVITLGTKFELSLFESKDIGEVDAALRFWRVIDSCVSLRSAGWVGEAGAMAIAAEALGLGISSTEHQSKSQQSDRPGLSSIEWGEESILVPVAGISQLLSTIIIGDGSYDDFGRETWRSLAGCAESSIGADGGAGPLVFLQRGLQSSLCRSESLRSVLVATIRRSVRLLAVVDYSGDDSNTSGNGNPDDDMDTSGSNAKRAGDVLEEENAKAQQPDARLTCFLTGLLLSGPVQSCVSDKQQLFEDLLQAWSIGLLSASAPWRMVCALTAAGILNECPTALSRAVLSLKTVSNFYARLQDTVLRRVWAERAAVPVCSRYVQSLIELLASVRKAELTSSSFTWGPLQVDAATPLPLDSSACDGQMIKPNISPSWEWDEGWVANDAGWETWVGTVECTAVDWVIPSRSAVRSLMDGGEGPPMLREGCVVTRGLDWDDIGPGLNSDADGKKEYEREKSEREREKKALEEQAGDDPAESELDTGDLSNDEQTDALGSIESNDEDATAPSSESKVKTDTFKKKKRTKIANPKLPIGTVLSIEPWDGVPAMARKVRWQLTGEEGIYRYGGGGGRFDICHVEVNEKGTRVRKRHPLPESAEQCVARHGFGSGKYSVLLRLRRVGKAKEVERYEREWHHEGVLEWPDFGAGVKVDCVLYDDGSVLLKETDLLFGSKDSGWEARFGQPSFIPGTEIMLSPTGSTSRKDMAEVDAKSSFMSVYQELLGSTSHVVNGLRNKSDGSSVRVTMEMKLLRGRRPDSSIKLPNCLEYTARSPPPISFDRDYHASSMTLSRDGRTLTCVSPDGRGSAFASIGFTRGVHYWEVKLEQADIGSVYIGVAEKPNTAPSSGRSSFGNENSPRLNRWLGWGFVNFRATYTAGAERVYGAHCHNEDTVGVLLDCDAGRVSFFYDGMKFGEHILNDLGCAFENISPFGFNADGCGSGGAGQGAPSGIEGGRGGRYHAHGVVRPRALWPVIGLRNPGDRVTMSTKWTTCVGIEGSTALKNALAVDELIDGYGRREAMAINTQSLKFPDWFVREAFDEYRRWHSRRWYATATRSSGQYRLAAFGLDVELDCSPLACAAACAAIGLRRALLSGDRVVVKRSVGRPLELAEEAVILGAHQCRLYYRLVSQKSEGGSLTAGGGRAWFWDESEVVGDSLQIVGEAKGRGVDLPLIDRFRCMSSGGIKVVYEGGAVVRSDLEIIDRSSNLGTIPANTIIPPFDVLERRVNSCGVIRYRIRYEGVGEGWISSRIRGGKEESIIEPVHDSSKEEVRHELSFRTPEEAAIAWYDQFKSIARPADDGDDPSLDEYNIATLDEFSRLASEGVIPGISILESDSIVTTLVSTIADYSGESDAIDCSFPKVAAAVAYAVASSSGLKVSIEGAVADGANQAAATVLTSAKGRFPSGESLMARMALIRALNRRVRKALPWLPARPSQEGTAILGGLCGHGASVERAGRRKLADSMALWVQVPSIASRVRSLKGLIFSSVKLEYLESVILATATPTPLSHDEYELPREIRTVRVNRLKARRVMAGTDLRMKRKHSVFAQLQSETKSWGGAALRRGFVAKGHGGQKRAFKVKLIGEGVNDYSGPYREVFTDAIQEVLEFGEDGKGALGVLDPTPNKMTQIGEERELFMFARGERGQSYRMEVADGLCEEELRIRKSFASLTMARDESSREVEDSLIFLGRLVGTAGRHGIPVDLPLPMTIVWNAIVEDNASEMLCLREVDLLEGKQVAAGETSALLSWEQRMLNSFVDGVSHVLPVELLPLLSGEELRAFLCGNPDVDVDLLKRVVEYEGYDEGDVVINNFWEALREMTNRDRKKFLQFVWARNRLPNKESDFEAPFKIQKDSGSSDASLPSASTCFFSLTLPPYSTKEILRDKLTFAIDNVCTMESDYVTNDAEVGEGWRGV